MGMVRLGWILVVFGVFSTSSCSDSPSSVNTSTPWVPRDVWLWRSAADPINDPSARASFFSFASSHAIRNAYVSVRTMLENFGTPSALTSTEANLRTFIEDAGSRSIGVHLLVGNGGSYLSVTEAAGDLYPAMSLIAGNAAAFSATLSGTKAVALHWDVEPQQLADFTANRQLYIQRLVNALQRTRGILSGSGLKQAADIQHHWDHPATEGATTCDPSNNLLTPAFTGQLGYQCLFRLLDQVVIMDYRDDPSLSIGQVTAELSFAGGITTFSGVAPKIIIGQEVASNPDPTLTFFDEILDSSKGTRTLEKALQTIQNQFNSNPGFGGCGLQVSYDSLDPRNSRYLSASGSTGSGVALEDFEAWSATGVVENFP